MDEYEETVVLRLSHRPGRDERMTTHVALTARALGADRVILPDKASDAAQTATDVTNRFGGPFEIEQTDELLGRLRRWDGSIAHLTMYGEPVQSVEEDIQESIQEDPLMIVVGAGKVPFEVYEQADWNIGVTNQPHSEIAALAVFLDRLFDGDELDRSWESAEKKVIPKKTGKKVEDVIDDN
ncbi:tRNA (cytidine(56)-2'-O)-methyltransferase [Salinarchaeum sp. IM2453]|uniref:tRNA (cytidine(56)-2'-O)-methyltransferase n=1 Tax=Salinarchaeum sp. IM2453 TaxID=2862870 RepID=UPI001C8285ED|nr:tRNA (cytidine(56)-2'-O)-methyltransferase [Salinarchaeum sp. IM2453]QZA88687.1 tRNA (cytidine(56)-2'-O)-methyltransferase [Salinarchaeum sp. IM2453]